MKNWEALKAQIGKSTKAVILSHRSPDGDSIGSSLALYHYLKNYIEDVQVITPDPAPKFLSWIKGFDLMLNYEKKETLCTEKLKEADLICCLDFNTPSRMGNLEKAFQLNTSAYIINIDHHQNPDDFADFQLSDTSASSTCQLMYDFVQELGDVSLLTKDIGEAIYTGIVTDTGSFRFSSTSKHTHNVVAQLIDLGINPGETHQNIYDNYSIDRLKLLGFALNERFNVYEQYSAGIIYLSEKDLQRFKFQKGDTEGLVNYPLSVGNIRMAILITEKDGKVKMSFRSKGDFHVNELAAKYFSGGGHFNAAGGISELNVLETVKKIEGLLPEYEDLLNA
ncbi:MAG: bifunctional oligoribonuclease/PAP phosphatase NrnA [Flavobacteriales bacterium]|nr:bifunctional oligoribonuclease/PAP phosphatase NrnA [Flavobacteriales bacterium]